VHFNSALRTFPRKSGITYLCYQVAACIGGFQEAKGAVPSPRTWGAQQVSGDAIWHLQNARKPFSGLGSAPDPAGAAYSAPLRSPVVDGEGASCPLPIPIPKNPTAALGLGLRAFGLSRLPLALK